MEGLSLATLFSLLVVVGLILLNGYFVAAEYSIVNVRRTRVDQLVTERHGGARAVEWGKNNIAAVVAVSQLGVTMASLGVGWLGEPAFANLIHPLFSFLPAEESIITSHAIATVLAFLVITCFHVIIGEQVPKIGTLANPEGVALLAAPPLVFIATFFRPLIALANGATGLVLRMIGIEAEAGHRAVLSVDELRMVVEQTTSAGLLEPEETEIAQRAFELGDLSARDVMVPRTEVVGLAVEAAREELLATLNAETHSRFPVYQGTIDNVVGILHVKDVLRALIADGQQPVNIRRLMREPLFVPETLPAHELLATMRRLRRHSAIALDEYGGTSGLVTIEDIVERLVGTMQDEFDQPELHVQQQADGTFLVNGLVTLDELPDALGFELESEDYTTIGGYVFGLLGRRPEVGDEVKDTLFKARVEALDGLRISLLRITPDRRTQDEREDDEAAET